MTNFDSCRSGVMTCTVCGAVGSFSKYKNSDRFCSKKCRYAWSLMASQAARGIGIDAQKYIPQKQLASALKVSSARISQLVKSGMPQHSVRAAKEWRDNSKRRWHPQQPSDHISDDPAVAVVDAASVEDDAGALN